MSNADDLRAMCLQVMKEHASIAPRGFDSIARRAELMRQWEDMYDDYLLELAVEQVSETATASGDQAI